MLPTQRVTDRRGPTEVSLGNTQGTNDSRRTVSNEVATRAVAYEEADMSAQLGRRVSVASGTFDSTQAIGQMLQALSSSQVLDKIKSLSDNYRHFNYFRGTPVLELVVSGCVSNAGALMLVWVPSVANLAVSGVSDMAMMTQLTLFPHVIHQIHKTVGSTVRGHYMQPSRYQQGQSRTMTGTFGLIVYNPLIGTGVSCSYTLYARLEGASIRFYVQAPSTTDDEVLGKRMKSCGISDEVIRRVLAYDQMGDPNDTGNGDPQQPDEEPVNVPMEEQDTDTPHPVGERTIDPDAEPATLPRDEEAHVGGINPPGQGGWNKNVYTNIPQALARPHLLARFPKTAWTNTKGGGVLFSLNVFGLPELSEVVQQFLYWSGTQRLYWVSSATATTPVLLRFTFNVGHSQSTVDNQPQVFNLSENRSGCITIPFYQTLPAQPVLVTLGKNILEVSLDSGKKPLPDDLFIEFYWMAGDDFRLHHLRTVVSRSFTDVKPRLNPYTYHENGPPPPPARYEQMGIENVVSKVIDVGSQVAKVADSLMSVFGAFHRPDQPVGFEWLNVNSTVPTKRLGMLAADYVGVDSSLTQFDDLESQNDWVGILRQQQRLAVVDMLTTSTPGTVLGTWMIAPQTMPFWQNVKQHYPYWRGTIQFQVQAVRSVLQKGIFAVVLHRIDQTPTADTYSNFHNVVVDISQAESVVFDVPFAHTMDYSETLGGEFAVSVMVVNRPQVCLTPTTSKLQLNVYIAAGKDFELKFSPGMGTFHQLETTSDDEDDEDRFVQMGAETDGNLFPNLPMKPVFEHSSSLIDELIKGVRPGRRVHRVSYGSENGHLCIIAKRDGVTHRLFYEKGMHSLAARVMTSFIDVRIEEVFVSEERVPVPIGLRWGADANYIWCYLGKDCYYTRVTGDLLYEDLERLCAVVVPRQMGVFSKLKAYLSGDAERDLNDGVQGLQEELNRAQKAFKGPEMLKSALAHVMLKIPAYALQLSAAADLSDYISVFLHLLADFIIWFSISDAMVTVFKTLYEKGSDIVQRLFGFMQMGAEEDKKAQELQDQSFITWLWGLLAIPIHTVTGHAGSFSKFAAFFRDLGFIGNGFKAVGYMFSLIKGALTYLGWCSSADDGALDKARQLMETPLLQEVLGQMDGMRGRSCHQVMSDPKLALLARRLREIADFMVATLAPLKTPAVLVVVERCKQYQRWSESLSLSGVRLEPFEPVFVLFEGEPGAGKSLAANELARIVNEKLGVQEDGYSMRMDADFDTLYHGQKVILIDDLFQDPKGEGISRLTQLISSAAYNMSMADIGSKFQQSCAVMVIGLANVTTLDVDWLRSPDALRRRFRETHFRVTSSGNPTEPTFEKLVWNEANKNFVVVGGKMTKAEVFTYCIEALANKWKKFKVEISTKKTEVKVDLPESMVDMAKQQAPRGRVDLSIPERFQGVRESLDRLGAVANEMRATLATARSKTPSQEEDSERKALMEYRRKLDEEKARLNKAAAKIDDDRERLIHDKRCVDADRESFESDVKLFAEQRKAIERLAEETGRQRRELELLRQQTTPKEVEPESGGFETMGIEAAEWLVVRDSDERKLSLADFLTERGISSVEFRRKTWEDIRELMTVGAESEVRFCDAMGWFPVSVEAGVPMTRDGPMTTDDFATSFTSWALGRSPTDIAIAMDRLKAICARWRGKWVLDKVQTKLAEEVNKTWNSRNLVRMGIKVAIMALGVVGLLAGARYLKNKFFPAPTEEPSEQMGTYNPGAAKASAGRKTIVKAVPMGLEERIPFVEKSLLTWSCPNPGKETYTTVNAVSIGSGYLLVSGHAALPGCTVKIQIPLGDCAYKTVTLPLTDKNMVMLYGQTKDGRERDQDIALVYAGNVIPQTRCIVNYFATENQLAMLRMTRAVCMVRTAMTGSTIHYTTEGNYSEDVELASKTGYMLVDCYLSTCPLTYGQCGSIMMTQRTGFDGAICGIADGGNHRKSIWIPVSREWIQEAKAEIAKRSLAPVGPVASDAAMEVLHEARPEQMGEVQCEYIDRMVKKGGEAPALIQAQFNPLPNLRGESLSEFVSLKTKYHRSEVMQSVLGDVAEELGVDVNDVKEPAYFGAGNCLHPAPWVEPKADGSIMMDEVPVANIPEPLFRVTEAAYHRIVEKNITPCSKISLEEAVAGFTREEPGGLEISANGVNSSSVSGVRMDEKFGRKTRGQHLFNVRIDGETIKVLKPAVEQYVRELEAKLRRGESVMNIYKLAYKDELRKQSKRRLGKIRLYYVNSMAIYLLESMYFGEFFAKYRAAGLKMKHTLGMDPPMVWDALAKYLGPKVCCGDVSGWDTTFPPLLYEVMRKAIETRYPNATEEDRRVRQALMSDAMWSYAKLGGGLYTVIGHKSGRFDTTEFGSFGHLFVQLMSAILVQPRPKDECFPPGAVDYAIEQRFVSNGDDSMAGAFSKASEKDQVEAIEKAYKLCGFKLTSANKYESLAMEPLEGAQYLQRKFVFGASGRYFPEMAAATIAGLCTWHRNTTTEYQNAIDALRLRARGGTKDNSGCLPTQLLRALTSPLTRLCS